MMKGRTQALLTFLCVATLLTQQAVAAELYVYEATAPLHQEPGSEEPVVLTLNYGDRVVIAETTDIPTPETWIKGKADGATICVMGYVRSAGLLPVPAPNLTKSGFESLTENLEKIDEPVIDQSSEVTTMTQMFNHGVARKTRTFHTAYGDFEEQHLEVTGITTAQGFLLARAMVNQEGLTSEQMTRTPKIEKDAEGNAFIFDDSHWQIISVKQAGNGVVISFPERAD